MTKYEIFMFDLRKQIKAKGHTFTSICKMFGIDRSAFSHRINRGTLTVSELIKICDLLGLEITITEKKGTTE